MSHVSKIELEIKSLSDLKTACKELGLTFMENRNTYKWYGRFMGDYPLPDGFNVEDLGKCDHAINVPGCRYEIGVIKTPQGKYQLLWDFWHAGGLEKKLGKGAGKLKQAYAKAKIITEAKLKGYKVSQYRINKGACNKATRLILTTA